MKPLRIIERVHEALRLQPMTIPELSVALWVTSSSVRCAITLLGQEGVVKCAGTVKRGRTKPCKLWRLA